MLALCPESVDLSRLAEDSASLALRFDSEAELDTWHRQLVAAQSAEAAAAAAAAAPLLPPEWDEASSTVSGS